MNHIDSQSILHENQHGFRSNRSCESQLLMTNDDITKTLNSSTQVDFSKAFDKVSHGRLSHRLEYYGISDNTRRWIDSFISNITSK
jgi:hypothetical protein